ncbi:MAG: right-handed parallel beta-helix repeat-containing protein [Planctomycetes bacterium]|nr:right-handed parallel beta-helix repeat-containing protein [Planctomycetota bacterium]
MGRKLVTCALCTITLGPLAAFGGDLNPPTGPIQPTNRVAIHPQKIAALPYTISQSGSYVLMGEINAASFPGGPDGIVITASNVTLDLNGFTLIGEAGSGSGISVPDNINNLRITNGTIRDWGGSGVDAGDATNSQYSNLCAVNNGANGLRFGNHCTVSDCIASFNATTGIFTGYFCTLSHCVSVYNGEGATVGHGFLVFSSSTVSECVAYSNGSGSGGGHGIFAGGSTITHCYVGGNGSGSATENDGINASASALVIECNASGNRGDGIEVSNQCTVRGNNCIANGLNGDGAGIHVNNSFNRIEDNNVTTQDRGIDVDGANNLIIRNSATGNTVNYSIVANNKVGVIVAAPNSGAINGSSGGAGLGTTDPWANFSY